MPIQPFPRDADYPQDEPKWLIYQRAVARLQESYDNCEVKHDFRMIGKRSGVERQIDIWLSAAVGKNHTVTVAVECKCFESSPVGIKDVEAFYGFLDDVGANKGILISNTGFTEGAKKRADGSTIELETLTLEEAETFDWADYVDSHCQGWNECWGSIHWELEDDDGSSAGFCSHCGLFHIECGNCGTCDSYTESEIVECSGCEISWSLEQEKGITIGIARIDTEPEDPDDDEMTEATGDGNRK